MTREVFITDNTIGFMPRARLLMARRRQRRAG